MLCNIAIFAVSVVMSGNDRELFANMLCAILICAYSIWQKNNTVQRYSTENLIVQDGKTIDDAKKALAKMYAGEDIHVVFIAAPAFGYLVGYWRNVLPLMYIELTLCILFVVLKIIYNNMSHLNNVLSLNSKKNDFPAKQMKQVNTFITAASAILILFGMLIFYNGRYGGLFGVIGSSVTGVVRILVKGFLWLLGKSGPEISNTPQMDDETQEDIEDAMVNENGVTDQDGNKYYWTAPHDASEEVTDPYDLYSWDPGTNSYIPFQAAESDCSPVGRGNGWYYYDEDSGEYVPW